MIWIRGTSALITAIIVGFMISGCSQAAQNKEDCTTMIRALESNIDDLNPGSPDSLDMTKFTENQRKAAADLRTAADKISNPKLKEIMLSFAADIDPPTSGRDVAPLDIDRISKQMGVMQQECGEAFKQAP